MKKLGNGDSFILLDRTKASNGAEDIYKHKAPTKAKRNNFVHGDNRAPIVNGVIHIDHAPCSRGIYTFILFTPLP